MRAVLTFDDQDQDGQQGVGMTVFLEGGHQAGSQAHQTAAAIVQWLDGLAASKALGDAKWVEGEDAAWIKGDIVALPVLDS